MRRGRLLLALLALPLLAGCLEVRSDARLEPDGAVAFVESVTIDLAKLKEARRIFKVRASGVGADPDALNPLDRFEKQARLRALRDADGIVEVAAGDAPAPKGHRRYVLRGRFRELPDYIEAGPVDDIEGALWVVEVEKAKAWRLETWSLYDDVETDVANRQRKLSLRRRLLEPFRSALESLRIERSITFPTRVLETNGVRGEDGRTVTWRIGFADIADPANLRQWAVFADGPDLDLETFGTKPAAGTVPQREAGAGTEDETPPAKGDGTSKGK